MKKISLLLFLFIQSPFLMSMQKEEKPEGPITNLPNEMLYKIALDKIMPDIIKAKTLVDLEHVCKASLESFSKTNQLHKEIVNDVMLGNEVQSTIAKKKYEILTNIQELLSKSKKYKGYDVLKYGIDERSDNSYTALMTAAAGGDEDIAKLLMSNGAKVNIQDQEGYTPLMMSCLIADGNPAITKFLIFNNATINAQNKYGVTPLMLACQFGNLSIVELLIRNKANVNAKNKDGLTALSYMCKADSNPKVEIIDLLLKNKAFINSKDNHGDTALFHIAFDKLINPERKTIIEFLLKNGANINNQNIDGDTVLSIATAKNLLYIAKLLLDHGADFNVKNKAGKSPLDIAQENKDANKLLYGIYLNNNRVKAALSSLNNKP